MSREQVLQTFYGTHTFETQKLVNCSLVHCYILGFLAEVGVEGGSTP